MSGFNNRFDKVCCRGLSGLSDYYGALCDFYGMIGERSHICWDDRRAHIC